MIVQVLWICVSILLVIAVFEIFWPDKLNEGFSSLIGVGDSPFWALHMPRRGDVGMNPKSEQGGYLREARYFADYVDVQNLGVKHDFCRMVQLASGTEKDTFFACALGGTEGLSSISFKTQSVKQGFQISRDDYMNMTSYNTIGYCRILKLNEFDTPFQAICTATTENGFKDSALDTQDSNPPEEIQTLLNFYSGIVFWLRLIDDTKDYAQNLKIMTAGQIGVEETPPKPTIARTLHFDGYGQFLKIGDKPDLSFGDKIDLRYLRAISFWVFFEEFTNNAKIFDFGNGAGKDNVFLGIIGRGNENASQTPIRLNGCLLQNDSTVPEAPSGAQNVDETTPEYLMRTSSANVNEFNCDQPEIYGRTMPAVQPFAMPQFRATSADLLYEVWDSQQRKLHVQIPGVFPLQKWTHVVLTTTNNDAARPTLTFYVNGELVDTEVDAWLPQNGSTTKNYIGKSNWADDTSQASNADELFKGQLFDFRGYKTPMRPSKLKDTYQWGLQKLGLQDSEPDLKDLQKKKDLKKAQQTREEKEAAKDLNVLQKLKEEKEAANVLKEAQKKKEEEEKAEVLKQWKERNHVLW